MGAIRFAAASYVNSSGGRRLCARAVGVIELLSAAGYVGGLTGLKPMTSERIVVDPAILVGKPVVRGTRLSVEFLLGLMADGWSHADIFENYPGLVEDDLSACLAYARDLVANEWVYPNAAE